MILDSPIISGSLTQQAGQTAEIPRYTAVSSSFLAASASFDARIDSIESTTASLSPRINALESFTASANATYVNVSGDSMSGGLTITGSLIVTDRITAQEFHTEYVSSSVVFQSGSTKFGDSGDDIHSFTGSLQVDGTVLASNLNGIFSSSAQITGSLGNYYIVSGTITQTTWDNIENKPAGIVSGSSQVVSLLPTGVVSGSSQITYSSISSIPAGIVSGAMQVTESLDVRYRLVGDDITFAELTFKPTLISGSSQLDGTTIQNLSGSFSGSFSGSYRGDGSGLTGLAAGAKFHTQTQASSTWTFVHNLSTQYPNVTVYDSNNNIVLPQSVTATNANTLVLEFGSPVSGYATAGIGGTIEVNGRTIKQYFTSSLSWRFEHNLGDRFATIQTYDSSYEKIIPQTISLTDATSSVITFPEVTEGWAVGTIGGDLPSISASYGGYVLQVSAGAPYTASWSPIAYVTASNAVNAISASHLNPISQSLVPAISGTYDLGSIDKPFRHIYVGTGSIYLVDNTGTIVKTLSGDTIVTNDNLSSLNAFTASNFTTNTFTSSTTARLNSIETISASNIVRLNAIEIVSASNIARIGSIETITASNISRLNALEAKTGSLATTGSNTFIGTQTITGSLYISSDLIVQGSSSLQNITASAVSIGTNIVNLNTANPAVRYAGLVIGDSGSIGSSGSFLYDSVQDEMIFVHRGANTTVTSSVLLMGPQTYDNIGNETYPTLNIIQKGTGNEHLVDSCIFDNGTTTCVKNNFVGTGTACFTGTLCANYLYSATNVVANDTIFSGGNIRKLNDNQCIFFRNAAGTVEATISGDGAAIFTRRVTAQNLSVISDSSEQITIATTTDANKQLIFGRTATNAKIIAVTQNSGYVPLALQPDGGNVGVGCNTPSYLLDVNGAARILSTIITNDSLLIGTTSTATGAKIYACNNAAVIFRAESTEDQAGLRLIAGCTSLNRASRIDFLNGATTRTTPQWTIINDYNQNGTNDLSIVNCDPANRPFKMFQSGIACFSNTICSGGTFISNVGASTSTYGFTHCGSNGYYGRFGVPNSSYMYLETNANSGVYIDSTTRTNCLSVNAAWSSGGGATQTLQVKSGTGGSGIWVESCSSDAGAYINMAGNCVAIGQSYRTSAGYNDILFQTAGSTRMVVRCAGNVEVQTGIISPMFYIERNSAWDDFSTGGYISLNDAGTLGLNAKFHQQLSPYVNAGEGMTWNFARVLVRITSNTGTFSQSLAGCIRNATYFYGSGWMCFGQHIQVGSTMDSGRGFKWVVMPWFSYSDFANGTDVPGFGLYNQFSDSPLRIGAVYLQYKA